MAFVFGTFDSLVHQLGESRYIANSHLYIFFYQHSDIHVHKAFIRLFFLFLFLFLSPSL